MGPSLTHAPGPGRQLPLWFWFALLALIPALTPRSLYAQSSSPPATPTAPTAAAAPNAQEVSSHNVEPTFKLQSERNLVMVRVVVRGSKGAVVENLKKEDFQLLDHGKPQTILHFSLEKPVLNAPSAVQSVEQAAANPDDEEEPAMTTSTPRRFVGLFFDDVNTTFGDLARSRDAADHFLSTSLKPGDRVGLFTGSGQKQVDFTDDITQIHQALFLLRPRPIIGASGDTCMTLPPYEAYLIVDHQDTVAMQVALAQIMNCNKCQGEDAAAQQICITQAQQSVNAEALTSLTDSETQATAALRGIEDLVRRMTTLPGQRSLVIISAGFLTETLRFQLSQITDRALRAGVVINAIDARGLYTDNLSAGQNSLSMLQSAGVQGQDRLMLMTSARVQTDGMHDLALDTGGVFFNNDNDLEAGLRKTAAVPDAYYLLAFSPQNLKLDGAFHPITVKLIPSRGLSVQARRGYYAPKKPADPAVQEKEEIREAVYSQDETHELPIDVHTQFFMKDQENARVTVLTRIDLRPLRFRKDADRNLDNLTFVTVVFDRDGHVVSGEEKAVELRLRDVNLDRFMQTGITMKSAFDVRPGTYLVRSIVRDSESGQISGLNRTVEIPYQ